MSDPLVILLELEPKSSGSGYWWGLVLGFGLGCALVGLVSMRALERRDRDLVGVPERAA